jgi:hypothetical protein
MRAATLLGGLFWGLSCLPGCAEERCADEACAERSTGSQAVHPIRSRHYRIALRVGPLEGRELRSEGYRLRAVAGAVRLGAKP